MEVGLHISKGWNKILCRTKEALNGNLWDLEYPLCPVQGQIPSDTLDTISASASSQWCMNCLLLIGISSHQEKVFPSLGEDFQGALQSQDNLRPYPVRRQEVSRWAQGGEWHWWHAWMAIVASWATPGLPRSATLVSPTENLNWNGFKAFPCGRNTGSALFTAESKGSLWAKKHLTTHLRYSIPFLFSDRLCSEMDSDNFLVDSSRTWFRSSCIFLSRGRTRLPGQSCVCSPLLERHLPSWASPQGQRAPRLFHTHNPSAPLPPCLQGFGLSCTLFSGKSHSVNHHCHLFRWKGISY